MRAKEGGKETTGETSLRLPSVPLPWFLAVDHQSLAFRARLCHAKNEAPEEEAVEGLCFCISVVDKKGKEDSRFAQFRPEALDSIRMEDLIKEYLTSKDNVRRHLQLVASFLVF